MKTSARTVLRSLALALTLAIPGGGCSSGDSPTTVDIDPDFGTNDPSVVVAIGDSITFGLSTSGTESCSESDRGALGFCPLLQSLTGKTVINEGVCGEVSAQGAARVNSVLARWRPGVLLIDYSPNDLFSGEAVTIRNLRTIVAAARANNTVPVLGTLVPAVGSHRGWDPFIQDLNVEIRALCAELEVECADHHQAFLNDPAYLVSPYNLLSADGLHPNAAGYALMAKTWRWPLLRVY